MNGNISAVSLSGSALSIGADGIGIKSITQTSSNGLDDKYTIFFTDGNTFSFTVRNGEKGETGPKGDEGVGITKIEKTGSVGLEDDYLITLSNKGEYHFYVTNGKDGEKGEKGATGAKGPKGDKGDKGEDGKDGKDAVVISTDVELVGTTGDSETAVMTQKATSEAIKNVTVGKNKVGTWAYNITGYSGKNGGSGGYYIDGGDGELSGLSELVYTSGVPIKCTIRVYTDEIGTWFDSYFTISGVVGTSKGINLSVDNFYTNSEHTEYDENATYSDKGVDGVYPELGYYIQHGKAILFICGHPGFGSFEFNTIGVSFGEENISQGEDSFNSGYGNQALGKYSSNFGNGNKAGYDTHTHGRNIDAAMAKDSILAGYGHKITDLVNSVALFGWMLECGFPYQTICGLWNKNKGCNLLEVGNGTSDGNERNAFEVDKNGLISANEKYIPNQTIYKNTLVLTDKEGQPEKAIKNLLRDADTGQIVGVVVDGLTKQLGQVYDKPSSTNYYGYVLVNKNTLAENGVILEESATYYLTVKYTIKQKDDKYANLIFAPFYSQKETGQLTQVNPALTVRYESRDYYITVPFTVTKENIRYGVFITDNNGMKELDITIDPDVRLYKAYDFDATLPVNTLQSDLMSKGVAVSKDDNIFCNYVLPKYMVNIRDNCTKVRIVPTDDINVTTLDVKLMSGEPADIIS